MMNKFKYLPMATVGLSSLGIMLAIILSGYNFEGGAAAVAIGAVLLTVTVISKKLREVTVLFYLSAALLFSGILMISESTCSFDVANSVTGKDLSVVAEVTGEKEIYPSKSVYILNTESVDGTEVDVKLRLISNSALNVYAGDKISFVADIYSVDRFDDSVRRYYMSEGIYLGANIYDEGESITLINDGSETFLFKLQLLRDEIKSRIYSVLPNEYGATAIAILLGDKSGMSDETLTSFRGSGIYHLFAVSGLHLSIWVLGFFNFLKKLGVSKRLNSFVALLFTFLFMLITGFTPSVTRSGIMLIVMMCGNLAGRVPHSLNSLGLSLFIILMFNPMAAASVSLLLSFSATLGIVTAYEAIDKLIESKLNIIKPAWVKKALKSFLSLFLVSVVVVIFTFPVSSFTFGEVCLIGPVTNVLISYAATLMMIFAGGIVLLFSVPFGVNFCALSCGVLAKYVIAVSDYLSNIPYASIRTDSILFTAFFLLVLCSVVCCFILIKNRAALFKGIMACIISLSIVIGCVNVVYRRNLTQIRVMDVDDGICLVIKNKSKTVVLGCGASDNYAIDDVKYEIYDKTPSLLVVPDNNEWNSLFFSELCSSFDFERIITGEDTGVENAITEPDFILNPWNGGSIEFHKTKDITYAYCVFGSDDMLIIFDSADGAEITDHLNADVLICSYYLPINTDLSSFGKIIISSTKAVGEDMIKKYTASNSDIYSTLGENDITLEMRTGRETKIFYDQGR